jgi:hypothetical protein
MVSSYSKLSKELVSMMESKKSPAHQESMQQALAAVSRAEAAEAEASHYAQILRG